MCGNGTAKDSKYPADPATMATPRVASPVQNSFGNGPNDPPILFQSVYTSQADIDEEEHCRSCYSTALQVDWKQGDRICTNCGVVAEQRLMDDRPEWKDFNEAEDLVKNKANGARSGMTVVDESKYLGGLQPTRLSSLPFGSSTSGYEAAAIRKNLMTTNRKLDHMMEKIHSKAMEDARLTRTLKRKRMANLKGDDEHSHDDDSVRPEYHQFLLQEEEDAHRMHTALHAEKWSVSRAMKLYGSSHEQIDTEETEEREQLLAKMDRSLKKASHDLYIACTMITAGATSLHLPERVINETTNRLVRYITRRDGFSVAGVSSRMSKPQAGADPIAHKRATEALRDCNQRKQVATIAAAFVFLTARNMGWARPIKEVCATFQPEFESSASSITIPQQLLTIKPKHCNRAMTEIKAVFPEYTRSTLRASADASNFENPPGASEITAVANLAAHASQKLQLPPVAEASVQTLLAYYRKEQITHGLHSGTKLSILCSSIIYFVSTSGSIMQRLARQTQRAASKPNRDLDANTNLLDQNRTEDEADSANIRSDEDSDPSDDEEKPFDVFSCPAVKINASKTSEYELRRMWDAWAEQISWSRTPAQVEQTCGVSRTALVEFYKENLYPHRHTLLEVLKNSIKENDDTKKEAGPMGETNFLKDIPMASTLLEGVNYAAPLKW